jgi:hypothetical protein
MGMTPGDFLEYFVDANADDCHAMPGDIRRAFNAAVAASHFADHFFAYSKRHNPDAVAHYSSFDAFLDDLSTATGGAFRDIRSIANAYKHLYTRVGENSTYCAVSSAGSIESVEIADDDYIQSIAGDCINDSPESGSRLAVVFTRRDGTEAEFLPTLDKVTHHFASILS